MILLWLILIPLIGGIVSLLVSRRNANASRWVALLAISLDLLLTLTLWAGEPRPRWLREFDHSWIPQFGIRFHLAVDGLSLALLLLTFFLEVPPPEVPPTRGIFRSSKISRGPLLVLPA